MGYAEGNTHGFAVEDVEYESVLFRLLDTGDFDTAQELIGLLLDNNYKVSIINTVPFVDLTIPANECVELATILSENNVRFRTFSN